MAEPFVDEIIRNIGQVGDNYYRLLTIVAPTGAGKTAALQEVHSQTHAPLLNINLGLSRRMLDLTERQRTLYLPRLLDEILDEVKNDVVLLDNIEILFDVSLKQDPLRLLQNLSRNKTLVVAWNGYTEKNHIMYATPDHPEYRRYQIHDFLVLSPKMTE